MFAEPPGKTVSVDIGDDEPIDIIAAPPPDVKFGSLLPGRYHFGDVVADRSNEPETSPRESQPAPAPEPIELLLRKLIAFATLRAP